LMNKGPKPIHMAEAFDKAWGIVKEEDYCRLCMEVVHFIIDTPQWGKICEHCYDEKEDNDEVKTVHGVYEDWN